MSRPPIIINARIIGTESFANRMLAADPNVRRSIHRAVDRLSYELMGLVRAKLSGPVLHKRSGWLYGSIRRRLIDEGDTIAAAVGVRTRVFYAKFWEFGFGFNVQIRHFFRRSGKRIMGIRISAKTGRAYKGPIAYGVTHVKAHTRHLEARSFLRSSLEEMRTYARAKILAAAMEGLR